MTTTLNRIPDLDREFVPHSNNPNNLPNKKVSVVVLGIGGAGCNAVSRAYSRDASEAVYYCLSTDQQYLDRTRVPNKVLLGPTINDGIGTSGFPETGEQAANESIGTIEGIVENVDLAIIVAGLGGGTGTGAVPVVVNAAKASGATVAAIVTQPSSSESDERLWHSERGLGVLREQVDSLILVSHDKIMDTAELSVSQAFDRADSIIDQGIRTMVEAASAVPLHENGKSASVKAILSVAALPLLS